ncbi:unnamed protein product [Paramecium sonneborni]|uniref:Uncharacterized protein n=1 Tax=Paramecium sonneborni TaxID=65129 RepID=A0A8S1MF87_9CILI|nr:unnamed protein product [Paramecium sonneborni]CAD8079282.1 unnamed protein product [Paramecium sonneborni]
MMQTFLNQLKIFSSIKKSEFSFRSFGFVNRQQLKNETEIRIRKKNQIDSV